MGDDTKRFFGREWDGDTMTYRFPDGSGKSITEEQRVKFLCMTHREVMAGWLLSGRLTIGNYVANL